MTDRITDKMLKNKVETINKMLNVGDDVYTYDENMKITGSVPNCHSLYFAYGSVALHRQSSAEHTGCIQVIPLSTRRDLFEKMQAYINALYLAIELKGEF